MKAYIITAIRADIEALRAEACRLFREADRLDIGGARSYADAVRAENLRNEANRILARIT